jgi:DNA-binding XRE family transcriptional regulator
MLNPKQIKAARALCGLSQAELGKLAHVSIPRIYAIENGHDCLQSTATAIRTALEAKGAIFNGDGSVNVREKDDRFVVLDGTHHGTGEARGDRATVDAAKQIVEAGRKRREPLP